MQTKYILVSVALVWLQVPVQAQSNESSNQQPAAVVINNTAKPGGKPSESGTDHPQAPAGLLAALKGRMLPPVDPVRQAAEMRQSRQYHDFLLAGDALLAEGDKGGALTDYRQAIAVKPDPGAWIKIGDVLWQQGKLQEAVSAYQAGNAVSSGGNSAAEASLGDAYSALGRTGDAVAHYQAALNHQLDARYCFQLALALSKQRDLAQAQDAYNQGIGLLDKDARPFWGNTFSEGEFGNGTFETAIHSLLSSEYLRYGYEDKAIAEMRLAVRLQPRSAMAHYFLAQALRDKGGQPIEMRSEYENALHLDQGEIHPGEIGRMAEQKLATLGKQQ